MNVLILSNRLLDKTPAHKKMENKGYLFRNKVIKKGTTPKEQEIAWADIILVMHENMKRQIKQKFPQHSQDKQIYSLDIPEIYYFNPPQLAEIIKNRFEKIF